jgi:hypothetical protein
MQIMTMMSGATLCTRKVMNSDDVASLFYGLFDGLEAFALKPKSEVDALIEKTRSLYC